MNNDTIEAKERILHASIQLFSEKGFDATSVTEIAKSADVTKALIYYYFNPGFDRRSVKTVKTTPETRLYQ